MKNKKNEKRNHPLFIILAILLSIPIIHESLFIIQDVFIKPPLFKLKNEQFKKMNEAFAKVKINKSAIIPKPMTLSGIKRGKNTRNILNYEFVKRRRPNWREQYKPQKMLGFGQYGTTFVVCVKSEDNCEYVIKCSRPFKLQEGKLGSPTVIGTQLIVNEVFALLDLAHGREVKNYVPKIYDFFSEVDPDGEETYYMVQEKLEKCYSAPSTLEKFAARRGVGRWSEELKKMRSEVERLIYKLNEYGWFHLDFHEDNVLCHFDGGITKYIIIDWGLSFCEDDVIDAQHPIFMHYADVVDETTDLSHLDVKDIKAIQKKSLDKWYRTVMEHSSFGSLEQKRRLF